MSSVSTASPVNAKTIRGAYVWTAGSNIAKQGLMFAISMLLARLLTPADYGLLGMVTALTVILLPIQDLGIVQAMSYFRDKEPDMLQNAAAIGLAMGVTLCVAMFASAGWIADFYNQPALIPIVRVMSVVFIFSGLRVTSLGMLMRDFRFKRSAFIEFLTIGVSAAVAIVMAWQGFGVWSLVANYVLSAFLNMALLLYFVPPRLSLDLSLATMKRLLGWSLPLTGTGFLNQFCTNVDYLIVGKLLGAEPLGYYTLAYRLANVVAEKVAGIVNRVSFPTFAALREEQGGATKHWLQLLEILGLMCFPLLAAVAINARDIVLLLLEAKWLPAVPVLQLLCWMGALKTIAPVTTNFISTHGRTDITFRISIATSILLPPAFYIGCMQAGPAGVAIGWAVVYTPIVLYQFARAIQLAEIPAGRVFRAFQLPVMVASVYGIPALLVVLLMPPGPVRLAAGGAVFAAAMGASMLHPELRSKARRILRR